MCSCSCSFSLSRLLFLVAPSLKCLVVSKVTCHRRSRIRLSSPVCRVFIQTQTTCWANETPGDYQILLHSWEHLSLPWHTRTSLLKFALGCQSSSNTPLLNVSSCCDIRGSQSDIIPLAKPIPGMLLWGLKVQYVQQSIPNRRFHAVLPKPEFADS